MQGLIARYSLKLTWGPCLLGYVCYFTALLSCGFQTGTRANLVAVASFLFLPASSQHNWSSEVFSDLSLASLGSTEFLHLIAKWMNLNPIPQGGGGGGRFCPPSDCLLYNFRATEPLNLVTFPKI